MSEELFREMRQLQQYAATLGSLMKDAEANAPQRSQAEDSTGAITVVLDHAGQVQEIKVASDWRRRVEPGALGGAVVDAFGQAAESRMSVWSRSLESGEWGSRIGKMMDDDARGDARRGETTPMSEVPAMFRRQAEPVTPRPIGDITDDMIKAFDNVDGYAGQAALTREFSGSNGSGSVTIRLSQAGLASCTVDAAWAATQPGNGVADALGQALGNARAKLKAAADEPKPTGTLDSLVEEAIALLNDPQRLADS